MLKLMNPTIALSIGVPAVMFLLNSVVILWQARGLEREIRWLKDVMLAKFETVDARFAGSAGRREAAQ